MLIATITLLLILLILLSVPITFKLNFQLPSLDSQDNGSLTMQFRFLGMIAYKKVVFFKLDEVIDNVKVQAKEGSHGRKWGGWIWQRRRLLYDCICWYRFSILTPPIKVLIYYGLEDPATTGLTCGYLGILGKILPKRLVKFVHYPDFVNRNNFIYATMKTKIIPLLALLISFAILIKILPLIFKSHLTWSPAHQVAKA